MSMIGIFTGSGSLLVSMTDTDFLWDPDMGNLFGMSSQMSRGALAADETFTVQSYLDLANQEFGIPGSFTPGQLGPLGSAAPPFGDKNSIRVVFDPTDNFSLTQTFLFTSLGGGASITVNTMVFVPEPVSLAVWSMLAGLVAIGWRRRRTR